ncbi:TerC family protein [Geminicoccus roseus]|uniref:TerC family protein n=1 Tax=Geminicoccus roseus TaxID=404900 RepID=UPI0004251DD0|nr:TerC family protein [Geminicoccus roseus]
MDIASFLFAPVMGKPAWMWLLFLGIVLTILVLDLGVLHRKQREIGVRESMLLSLGYMGLAGLFGLYVLWQMGGNAAAEFYTGYLIEWSLSLDNVFVISLIFTYFHVPRIYQHRVLFWGIIGVIVMRGTMIFLGAALVHEFDWVMYLFGAFLLFTGVKLLMTVDSEPDIASNPVLKITRRLFRVTDRVDGNHFFIHAPHPVTGKMVRYATPLFMALVLVEFVDLVFAVDSVPAIFAITKDPFIVYTSNIFAVLGLRSLYFALAAMIHRFHYLKYALALVLIFIGGKIFYTQIWGKMDPAISLGITFAILVSGVVYSFLRTRREGAV